MSDKPIVLYIAGTGRSGSTILSNILDQINGFFAVGEILYIWRDGFAKNLLCGCGKEFQTCEIWNPIFQQVFADIEPVDPETAKWFHMYSRTTQLLRMAFPGVKSKLKQEAAAYLDLLDRLYRSIQITTGCRVIIDSSKLPGYGYWLGLLDSVDLYVLHLIRDPRAIAYSWQRKKFNPSTGRALPQMSPTQCAINWSSANILSEVLWRRSALSYLRLRYEDFVQHPKANIENILKFVGSERDKLPFVEDDMVMMNSGHSFGGNPNRYKNGVVKIKYDDEWQTEIRRMDWLKVTSLTWLMLLRYSSPNE